MRILVVDDDVVMTKVFVVMLKRTGYEVDSAGDGQMGVDMWENGNYDLVLMDVQMPKMNGFDATRAIREKERTRGKHTPIVAITAFALQTDEMKCRAAGMDAYLSKPVDFDNCIEMIRDLTKCRDRQA